MANVTLKSCLPVGGKTLSQRVSSRRQVVTYAASQDKEIKFVHKTVSNLAAAGLALSIVATPALALAEPDLELGADIFNGNCAACHSGGGNSVKPGYTLEKDAIQQYLETPVGNGLNVTAIVYQVQNGKNAMPAWSDRLDDEEIDAVSAYVYDMASNDKW
uniref:Cytochrome c-553 n=1 Tax=Tetraselmis sp. GSL018 TaxID=582737 RepID=A0A061R2G0_9CHLO|mmetsp:Transcript_18915/g.45179  ORF Transcript_18915/g.45179 Transcript_18915/m.45179 type:complete len:160 (-) Transcript_18915:75-554(-)|eukprot:CAMPEP_0177606212 /NCGR_PEP_ID=MMETSP0419_2-20121207/17173_1 /TAXON_ID=582737 /ORGANISM="Tetraselmis sp., Strain GSL018" /LENGTH=159 /DNA_ID=CAMNT_0019100531 /DNA_START=256 /DNA_END=735 /DNA_ORIENTATION=+